MAADDTKLYLYSEPAFSKIVTYPTEAKFSLAGLVSAPNVVYTVANSTTIEVESKFLTVDPAPVVIPAVPV